MGTGVISPDDRIVIEVAKKIAEKGMSLVEALKAAGVKWSPATFERNLRRVAGRIKPGSSLRPILEKALRDGVGRTLMTSAGAGASGGLLGWIAAHPLLFAALMAVAGIGTAAVSNIAGTLMADGPTAVAGPGSGRDPHQGDPALRGGGYLPVVVHVAGKPRIVSVRSVDAIRKGIAQSNFRHGGISATRAQLRVVAGSLDRPFRDAGSATAALCKYLRGPLRKPPLAAGTTVSYNGRAVTLDDWGLVDFVEVRRRVN